MNGVPEAESELDDVSDKAEDSENRMSAAFKKIGSAIAAAFAVDKIVEFGKAITEAASTVAAEQSAFEQIMGDYSDIAQEKVNEIADATGMVSTRLTPYMTSMTAKFKGLGYDIDDATTLASDGLNIAADAAAFWDMSLDDSMSHLNSFINGSYEGGEAIGLFANDTQMAMYAVQTGLVESTSAWSTLDEATKQATRLEYAQNMMEASGATGQAAKEADQYANVQANLTEKWRQFKAQIGEPLLQNVVLPAMDKLSSLVDDLSVAFQALSGWISDHKEMLDSLALVIGIVTTAMTIQAGVQAVKTAMNAAEVTSLGALIAVKIADATATMAALAPYIAIAAAIAAVIAVIVILVKNWDEVKEACIKAWNTIKSSVVSAALAIKTTVTEKFEEVKSKVTEIWENVKESILTPVESAKEKIKSIIDTISGFFTGAKLSFPNISLPHFTISPSGWKIGDLLKGSIPKLGIEWYAKAMNNAMLLDKPTIFGESNGTLLGGGEVGQEVVAGSNTLTAMIRGAVQQETSGMYTVLNGILSVLTEYLPGIPEISNMQLVMDTGAVVGQLAPAMDSKLGSISRMKGRGQ